jgi:tryptophan synthase alpha chain
MPSRIEKTFKELKVQGRSAFIPYVTAGDPDINLSQKILNSLPSGGADIIEVGMPFSDPMADGPAIQQAGIRALGNGQNMKKTFSMVKNFRLQNNYTPLILMGYYNPILQFGNENFLSECSTSGVDGLIVVDLPIEHSQELCKPAQEAGIDFINFITPTTSPERLKNILDVSTGFLYYVSIAGITGTKTPDIKILENMIKKIKTYTNLPVGVGFGIKDAEQVKNISKFSDAIVIGSSIVNKIKDLKIQNLRDDELIESLVYFLLNLSNGLQGRTQF